MPNKIKIDKEELYDLIDGSISDTEVGSKRWCNVYETIFPYNDKLYKVLTYRATGDGEHDTFNYEDSPIEVTEVEPYEKTITAYREVK